MVEFLIRVCYACSCKCVDWCVAAFGCRDVPVCVRARLCLSFCVVGVCDRPKGLGQELRTVRDVFVPVLFVVFFRELVR